LVDESGADSRYSDGRYTPIPPVLADCPTGADVDEYLRTLGWLALFTVGDPDTGGLSVDCWQHASSGEFMAAVQTSQAGLPFVVVATFGELMDLLTRWAPLLSAAQLAAFVGELREWRRDDEQRQAKRRTGG
jgi:hypothetical protein